MRSNRIWLISLLLGWGLISHAQKQHKLFTQHKFHRLNEEQGLIDNVINDIDQDTLGYIWVATDGGIYRYLNNQFHCFKKERYSDNTLPHNMVYNIFIDDQNQVWALTGGGVTRYNYVTDGLVRYQPDMFREGVTVMEQDQEGNYFFGGYSGVYYDQNGELTKLPLRDDRTGEDLSNKVISDFQLIDDVLWIIFRYEGYARYELRTNRVDYTSSKSLIGKEYMEIFDSYWDGQRIWFVSDWGLWFIAEEEDNTLAVKIAPDLPKDDYMSITEDKNHTFWIGSRQHGAFSFRYMGNDQVNLLEHFLPEEGDSGISHRTISSIVEDKSGLIWLGTHNGGINVFNPDGETVRSVTHHGDDSNSLSYENVWGIAQSPQGSIWVGTDGKGINKLDPVTGKVTHPNWPELEKKAVLSALEDDQSRLWLGTYESGVYMVDLSNGKIRNFRKGDGVSDMTRSDIREFYQLPDGRLFIGVNFGGIYYFNEEEQTFRFMQGSEGLDVRTMEAVGSQLYLGTFNAGLIHCDLERSPRHFEHLFNHANDKKLVINSTYYERDTVWMATKENGLVSYDITSGHFHYYPEDHVLRNISISGIANDLEGNLWLTTNEGIYAYERKTQSVKLFDYRDGIQLGHFNYNSIFLSSDGYLVAGGINGMNLFYPEELLAENPDLQVTFDEIKILNEKMTPGNSDIFNAGKSIFLTDKITLDHSANVFLLRYSTPGFSESKQNKFKYMLEGYDRGWQSNHDYNEATYKNVPPGEYTFKVRSINNSVDSKQLKIVIVPPIWMTWPAYILYMLVIGLITWWINRFSNSRMALKQKLQFEQELREKEQHVMEEKLRFYTNFSHELKTPLTLIQGPVNDLIKIIDNPLQRQNLELIRKNTKVLLKFIGRMLEFRKMEMNKTVLNVGLQDMTVLAQEEAESFAYLANQRGIKFGFYCENKLEAWVDIEKIQIVINNLLSNAFKFTKKGQAIKFGVFQEGEFFIIEVKDEGVGINPGELNNVFSPFYQASNSTGSGGTGIGLALSKSFVELHGGRIHVESKPNEGTKFLVSLPLGKAHLEGKPHVRFIEVVTEEIETDLLNEMQEKSSSEGILDSDKVVLVVDDNKDIATYVSSLFEANYKVIKCDNASDALEKSIESIPDIIISDMMMPGMDGLEFCRELKDNIATSHIPVILLTAKNSSKSKLSGFEVGADDYITKPFNSELLIARVNNILGNRKLLQIKYGVNDLFDPASAQNSKEEEFVLKAEKVILEKLEQSKFTVPELCKELGMSRTSLYRKVKSITGVSIQLFIRKIKIKRAAQLLVTEESTVTEIAFSLDFSDLKYFRKCFKEQFDMTPSEYKNWHESGAGKEPSVVI